MASTDERLDNIEHKIDVLALEIRAGNAESRSRDADLNVKLNTIIDVLTGLQQEYVNHSHPPTD